MSRSKRRRRVDQPSSPASTADDADLDESEDPDAPASAHAGETDQPDETRLEDHPHGRGAGDGDDDLEAWAREEDALLEDDDEDDGGEEWEIAQESGRGGPRDSEAFPRARDAEFRVELPTPGPDNGQDSDAADDWNSDEAAWENPGVAEFRGDLTPESPTPPESAEALRFYRSTGDADLKAGSEIRRRTRRKKRQIDHTPEWDRQGAGKPEKPSAPPAPRSGEAASWSDAGEVADPDARRKGERKSVRRKKRLPTKLERMFVSSPKVFTVVLAIVIVTLVLVGTIGALKVARQSTASAIEQARSASLENPSLDPSAAALVPFFLTTENLEAATKVVENYLTADGWEQKLSFVRRPTVAKELMPAWYSLADNIGRDASATLGEVMLSKQTLIDGMTFVMLAAMVEPDNRIQFFAVQRIGEDQYKVDWEVSEGYQEMPLQDFRRERPTDPVTLRVKVQRSDYYNGEFSDTEKYAVYKISYPSLDLFEVYGYVERGTPLEQTMEQTVGLGVDASLIVKLAYPPNAVESNQVLITELVHRNWFPGYE